MHLAQNGTICDKNSRARPLPVLQIVHKRLHPNAKLIFEITEIDASVEALAGGAGSRRGTGGMRTKLAAARLATAQGIDTVVTNGKNPSALFDIVEGQRVGTLFYGKNKKREVHV